MKVPPYSKRKALRAATLAVGRRPRRLTIVIDAELLAALDQIRVRDGVPVAEQVRRALRQFIAERAR